MMAELFKEFVLHPIQVTDGRAEQGKYVLGEIHSVYKVVIDCSYERVSEITSLQTFTYSASSSR